MSPYSIFLPLSSSWTLFAPRCVPPPKKFTGEDELLGEGCEMERLFSLIFILRMLRAPVLYSHLHLSTPRTCQSFYSLPTEQLSRADRGLQFAQEGTSMTANKALNNLLFTSAAQIFSYIEVTEQFV